VREKARKSWTCGVIVSLLICGCLLALLPHQPILAQGTGWSEPVLLSTNTVWSWFPDVAVDADGRIHVVYDSNVPVGQGESVPGVVYTVFQNGVWSEPNDLHVGGQGNIFRVAIATDHLGNLHMTCKQAGAASKLYYWQAPAAAGYSARSWNRHVLDDGLIYISDVAVDSKNVIHVVYDKWVSLEEPLITEQGQEVTALADIFYRRSADGGHTWSVPVNLSRTPGVGSYRAQLQIDAQDVIHVTWNEGWDRWALYDAPREGIYIHSTDGGMSWSEPAIFSWPENTNAQMAAASDDRGGVLVVWRPTTIDRIFYSWSTDNGVTWSEPQEIPGLYARAYNDTVFDAYDMGTDSAGHIHLVAVGRSRLPENRGDRVPLGVYHLMWDGESWSEPRPIAVYTEYEDFPEYPKLAISEGNQLHVVWFVREQQFGGEHYRIFYSHAESAAPRQTPVPTPTPTATPAPTATPLPAPTNTPIPTLPPDSTGIPAGLYTENDEVGYLALGVAPVILIGAVIAAVKLGWIRRLFHR